MKNAILKANQSQIEAMLNLFNSVKSEEREVAMTPSFWRPTDVVAHLWAWQTVSTARVYAALEGRNPDYPAWFTGDDEEVDATNLRIYENYKHWRWSEAMNEWETNYQHLIELGKRISEMSFLNNDYLPWLPGYSVADVFIYTYHHHLEHQESFTVWLNQRGVDGFMWI